MKSIVGSLVVLKFYYGHKDSINPIISKTLGRISVIDLTYLGSQPQSGTFWICRIKEMRVNPERPAQGCFVVTPIKEIPTKDILKLLPSTYTTEISGSDVILTPQIKGHAWICPFSIKNFYIKAQDNAEHTELYHSVIVPLDESVLDDM